MKEICVLEIQEGSAIYYIKKPQHF